MGFNEAFDKALEEIKMRTINNQLFEEIFKDVNDMLNEIDWNFLDDEFNCFHIADTYYMLELETGILITYYKQLGRANDCNYHLYEPEYKHFANKLKDALEYAL